MCGFVLDVANEFDWQFHAGPLPASATVGPEPVGLAEQGE